VTVIFPVGVPLASRAAGGRTGRRVAFVATLLLRTRCCPHAFIAGRSSIHASIYPSIPSSTGSSIHCGVSSPVTSDRRTPAARLFQASQSFSTSTSSVLAGIGARPCNEPVTQPLAMHTQLRGKSLSKVLGWRGDRVKVAIVVTNLEHVSPRLAKFFCGNG